jgi:hypothetical protein
LVGIKIENQLINSNRLGIKVKKKKKKDDMWRTCASVWWVAVSFQQWVRHYTTFNGGLLWCSWNRLGINVLKRRVCVDEFSMTWRRRCVFLPFFFLFSCLFPAFGFCNLFYYYYYYYLIILQSTSEFNL